MTIPNLITIIRILLAPLFAIYLINNQLTSALVVFVLAGVSDGADGFVARVFNQKSTIGAFLDPLADKLLLVSAYIILAARGYLPPWLTVLVISRDVLILLGVLILFLIRSEFIIKPSMVSKVNTCLQLATVVVALSRGYLPFLAKSGIYLYWVTAVFTIASGLHYMHSWFIIVSKGGMENVEKDGKKEA